MLDISTFGQSQSIKLHDKNQSVRRNRESPTEANPKLSQKVLPHPSSKTDFAFLTRSAFFPMESESFLSLPLPRETVQVIYQIANAGQKWSWSRSAS